MEQNDGFDTLLMDYCRGGDPRLPGYLLDNGADPNLGGLTFMGALLTAINSDQPPSLISKMIECRAKVQILDVVYAIVINAWTFLKCCSVNVGGKPMRPGERTWKKLCEKHMKRRIRRSFHPWRII